MLQLSLQGAVRLVRLLELRLLAGLQRDIRLVSHALLRRLIGLVRRRVVQRLTLASRQVQLAGKVLLRAKPLESLLRASQLCRGQNRVKHADVLLSLHRVAARRLFTTEGANELHLLLCLVDWHHQLVGDGRQ